MKYLAFRFDIDTHKCIRDGVPNLLLLSEKYNVPFTFFLNAGKAISFWDSIKNIFSTSISSENDDVLKMSALQKLGKLDYIYAALVNPNISNYKAIIKNIFESNCELGIHGGRNHALWARGVKNWTEEQIVDEVEWALKQIRKLIPEYDLRGFASPEWESSEKVEQCLADLKFQYLADYRCLGRENVIKEGKYLPYIGTNLCGEPGGVAYFENCRVRGMNSRQIVEEVLEKTLHNEVTVLFDHPYYAGVQEIECIEEIVCRAKSDDIKIITLNEIDKLYRKDGEKYE